MTNETKRSGRPRWHRHLTLGLACTAGSWVGEGLLHSLMTGRLGVSGLFWPEDPHELWMRALIAALMLAFTAHVVHDVRQLEALRIEAQRLHRELDVALTHALAGFIPVCSSCKGIRRDDGDWERMESYLAKRTEAEFTHGLCPDCREQLYPGLPHAPVVESHVSPNSR